MAKQRVEVEIITEAKNAIKSVMGYAAAIGLTAKAVGKAISAIKDMVDAYSVQEQAEVRLESAIRATGRAHEISSGGLFAYAAELQKITTYGDEVTISAMAMLQQLGDLDQQGLQRVTPAVMDFAAAMGMNLDSAASMVGRTLSGTTNMLSRYGIDVDMAGSKSERLAQITETLDAKFGGMAKALRDTTDGSIKAFNNAWGDSQEIMGETIENGIRPMRDALTRLLTSLNEVATANKVLAESYRLLEGGIIGEGEDAGAPELEEAVAAVESFNAAIKETQARLDEPFKEWLKALLSQPVGEETWNVASFKKVNKERLDALVEQRDAQQELVDVIGEKLGAEKAERLETERLTKQRQLSIQAIRDEQEAKKANTQTVSDMLAVLRTEINTISKLRDEFESGSEEYIIAQSQVDLLAEARTELRAILMDKAEFSRPGMIAGAGAPGDLGLGSDIKVGQDHPWWWFDKDDAKVFSAIADEVSEDINEVGMRVEEGAKKVSAFDMSWKLLQYQMGKFPGIADEITGSVGHELVSQLADLAFFTKEVLLGFEDAEGGLASYFSAMLPNMDKMLFDAGFRVLVGGGPWEVGVALMAASGLVSLGMFLGGKAGAQEGWVFGGGSGHSPIKGGNNTNYYNVEGSLVRESDLDDRIMDPVTASRANH